MDRILTVEKSQTNATNVTDASAHAHNLRTHLIMNSGEKSNKCIQCDFPSFEASKLVGHLKTHTGEKSDKCNQWNYTTFLHRVSGWQFGKTKSYHHTSTKTKFWKCKDWVDADIYKLTVHQHTCVCHHVHLQSFMDIDLLLCWSQWDQTAKMVPKSPDFAMALTYW